METGSACEIISPEYRYLQSFFTTGPILFLADPATAPPADKERKIDQALQQLEDGIQDILQSDNYRKYLETVGKFHDYSLGNLILIVSQKPDASRVAGYNTWRDLGRQVKKGESGLMILAPCFPPKGRKEKRETEEDEEEEKVIQTPVFFRVVYVFDISQTEGEDIPFPIEVPIVQGDDSGPLFKVGSEYLAGLGLTLIGEPKAPVTSNTMGYFDTKSKEIWVKGDAPQNQQTKSLFHEIAHERATERYGPGGEVIAESCAYAVCFHFGLDTGTRSFPYVAGWAKDIKVFKERLDQIRIITKEIIEGIAALAEMNDPIARAADFAELGMKMITKEVRRRLPPIKSQEFADDPIVQVKFFAPWTYWIWYAYEFDGDDEFFGLVRGHDIELGYFSLSELESMQGPFGLKIERDLYFEPQPLSEVRKQLEAGTYADSEPQNLEGNMSRVTEKDIQAKLDWINRRYADLKIARKYIIGKRYGTKSLDYNGGSESFRSGLTSSELNLIADGMALVFNDLDVAGKLGEEIDIDNLAEALKSESGG